MSQLPTWTPRPGSEIERVLGEKVPPNARPNVIQECSRILSRCLPAAANQGSRTGLVVGYVQSGKTLSFTAASALAADNGYQMVIVIAGTTNDLADQSKVRLLEDLGVNDSVWTRWQHFHNPSTTDSRAIQDALDEWNDPVVPRDEKRTVLVTVLKQHSRLERLTEALSHVNGLDATPTIIIDDEADQASLNTLVGRGELSTTFRRLAQLRALLGSHSFLQYTATPQGNLLISILDVLSPSFVVTLTPGDDYVGGDVFSNPNNPYLRIIPFDQIPQRNVPPPPTPPESLMEAMRVFFLGAAQGIRRKDSNPRNRSMMVHPSRLTVDHRTYYRWVVGIKSLWLDVLSGRSGEQERQSLLDLFESAYRDLRGTVNDLDAFAELIEHLPFALRRTHVREINSVSDTQEIVWRSNYAWILVGGQVLDRGFTVEGLTVTYMPRGPGVGNADTIQQRARFLGYKRQYLGYCRIYLDSDVANAYQLYVDHESDIRRQLDRYDTSNRSLDQLRRIFICDGALRPTRSNIIDIAYSRLRFPQGWYVPRFIPVTNEIVEANRTLCQQLLDELGPDLVEQPGHARRTEMQIHQMAAHVSMKDLHEQFLAVYNVGNMQDSDRWLGAVLLLERYLDHDPEAGATVFRMAKGLTRTRTVNDNGRIVTFMQGANPSSGATKGAYYPGDRRIVGPDPLTVQLHYVDLVTSGDPHERLYDSAPLVTLHLSENMRAALVAQPQGGVA